MSLDVENKVIKMKGVSGYILIIGFFAVLLLSLYGIIAHGADLGIWITILLLIVSLVCLILIGFIAIMLALVIGGD